MSEVEEAWRFRARVEREAARRFARLAAEILASDPESPVPELLRAAVADEERHALLCAELAGSEAPFSEPPRIAPSGLSARDAALYEMVAACCVSETESVAVLTTLLACDCEPRVREVLHEIARDEVQHARMGWTHLAREAARGDVTFLGPLLPAMLAGSLSAEPSDSSELLRYGVLPRRLKREVFERALLDVVLPGLAQFGIDVSPAHAWLAAYSGTLTQSSRP